MDIAVLSGNYSDQVAKLHLAYLPTGFAGIPGCRLVSLYYEALEDAHGGVGYVAVQEGKVHGFVCGVWRPEDVSRRLRTRALIPLLFWTAAQVAIHPAHLGDLFERRRSATDPESDDGYELRPIVVDPAARGTGVARQLALTLLKDAGSRGYTSVHLYTDRDNVPARRFYEKLGFAVVGSVVKRGRELVKYSIDLIGSAGGDA